MIISELKLYDFRKFHEEKGEAGLSIIFHKGLNALIGENDSGKTAVIDALKLVLLTQSNDYVRPAEEDFYCDSNNEYVDEFRIECVISEFDHKAAFSEYLESNDLDNRQIYFVNQIVEYIVHNGMMKDLSVLQESPFTDQGSVVEIFTDLNVWKGIRKVIDSINDNARVA